MTPAEKQSPARAESQSQSQSQAHSPSLTHSTPPKQQQQQQQQHSSKSSKHTTTKHVAHGSRAYPRVSSGKNLHKLTSARGHGEGSHTDLKKLGRGGGGSTTSLKKGGKGEASSTSLNKRHSTSTTSLNKRHSTSTTSLNRSGGSQASLKRNRSSVEVERREKETQREKTKAKEMEKDTTKKRPTSVHFEIGDQDDDWEEASSTASPALTKSASQSARSSAKPSANNSEPQSPLESPTRRSREPLHGAETTSDRLGDPTNTRNTADAKVITERLLQRIPSHSTTQMTLDNAARTSGGSSPPDSSGRLGKSHHSTLNSTPKDGASKEEVVSRFVGGSGTPSENSPFLQMRKPGASSSNTAASKQDAVKRTQSEGNLARDKPAASKDEAEEAARHQHHHHRHEEDESLLAPRSRKSSTGASITTTATSSGIGAGTSSAYNPYLDSRTQQKLWLQRASSNIEPQQLAPGNVGLNGIGISSGGGAGGGLGLDSTTRDPRVKVQLERTGLEYLVVRRHQDPVGLGVKRLALLPGADRERENQKEREKGKRLSKGLSPQMAQVNGGPRTVGLSSPSHSQNHSKTHSKTQSLGRARDLHKENGNAHAHARASGKVKERPREREKRTPSAAADAHAVPSSAGRTSFEGAPEEGSERERERERERDGDRERRRGDEGNVDLLLRSLWEKSGDLSASA